MICNKTFAVVGGDQRNAHLANTLTYRENGYTIYSMYLDKDVKLASTIHKSNNAKLVLPQTDVVIFPLPLLDGAGAINTPLSDEHLLLSQCLDYISPDATVLAGKVNDETLVEFEKKGIEIIDYLEREEFAVYNAILTVEGAVEIAMRELPITLFGSTCVITGFGRIGKLLARQLQSLGARVQVVARKCEDLAWIRAYGYEPVPIGHMTEALPYADLLFNTVPAIILGEDKLRKLGRNCLVIDLASKPGGVDFDTAKNLGLKTIWALSLPGKVAPMTAGEIILDTVCNILRERGKL